MGSHEEFWELCAAATAGELSPEEQSKLATHLAICADCRRVKSEYEAATLAGVAALSEDRDSEVDEAPDLSWSVDDAQKRFFERLAKEDETRAAEWNRPTPTSGGKRHTYRPSKIRWLEIWMPFAAAILLALALGVLAYRSGVKRGDSGLNTVQTPAEPSNSLEAQVSDAGYERAQLEAKLEDSTRTIADLKRQLAEQTKIVSSLRATVGTPGNTGNASTSNVQIAAATKVSIDAELSAAQGKLAELQKTVDAATAQRDENARQATALEGKISELSEQLRNKDLALNQSESDVAKRDELLQHDRDIRELMGARELYMADVHDVSGNGTEKTYGRVFYTRGKRLIFYAFDLDAQPGVQNAKSFQAWGRRGPDKQQARSLGIFYEDNASKQRWVLKADDSKSLQDIDAVFVTVEPNGGSPHPSGQQLLFAYLRIDPNHP